MVSSFDKLSSLGKSPGKKPIIDAPTDSPDIMFSHQMEDMPDIPQYLHQSGSVASLASKDIKVPTGIVGFDKITDGGFRKSSINLISGRPGSGKSIFCTQFLINGILKNDENAVYISFEENKNNFYMNMIRFGWNLAEFERQGKFIFLEYTPEQIAKIMSEGGGLLDSLMEKANAGRLVVDPISSFLLLESNELSRRETTFALFRLIHKWKTTTILADGRYISSPESLEKNPFSIDFEVDSMSLLYNLQKDFRQERQDLIEVYKMRGSSHMKKPCPYLISDQGIEVFPKGYYTDKGLLKKK